MTVTKTVPDEAVTFGKVNVDWQRVEVPVHEPLKLIVSGDPLIDPVHEPITTELAHSMEELVTPSEDPHDTNNETAIKLMIFFILKI